MDMWRVADNSVADYALSIQTAINFINHALETEDRLDVFRALQQAHDVLEKEYDETPEDAEYDDLVDRLRQALEGLSENKKRNTMKREFLEYLIRECVNEVLEAFPAEPETVGAPAPPAAGQGTADQPAIPQQPPPEQPTGPLFTVGTKGIWYVNPNLPTKPRQISLKSRDKNSLPGELYGLAAKDGGPRLKIAISTPTNVLTALQNPNTALFLYIGHQNEGEEDLYLLTAKTYEEAKANSVPAGTSAEHPTGQFEPQQPGEYETPQVAPQDAQKTLAPDIDESAKLRNMLSSMVKEALVELQ